MRTFTANDLHEHADELVRDAEAGELSLVLKDGQPVFLALPFDETLLREGLQTALAIKLFDEETLSLGQAARLAGMDVMAFMERLAALRIPVARPRHGELEQALEAFG
jgi:predicted HTH domain antitoxin